MSQYPQYRVSKAPCPSCGNVLEGAGTTLDYGPPEPGDMTICIECATIATFTPELTLRRLSTPEFEALPEQLKQHLGGMQRIMRSENALAQKPPS